MQNEYRTPDPVQGFSQRVEEASPRIALPAPLEWSAAGSKTSRSAWGARRRRELAACCGWSRTTQPRSVLRACGSHPRMAKSTSRIRDTGHEQAKHDDFGPRLGADTCGCERGEALDDCGATLHRLTHQLFRSRDHLLRVALDLRRTEAGTDRERAV